MDTVEITIERRAGHGKGPARQLRRSGKAPAVLYGPKREAVAIAVSASEFDRKVIRLEGTHLIKLVQSSAQDALKDTMVLLRETQRHPVTGQLLHVDFYEVDLTERVTVPVTLHFVGKAAGVTAGGVLQVIHREIEIECLPTEIPDFIEVDVTALAIHSSVHVKEIQLPAGVTAAVDAEQPVVTVVPPNVETKTVAGPEVAAEAAAAPAAADAPAKAGAKKE